MSFGFWGATNMKILVACEMPEAALGELRELGLEVVHEPGLSADDLQENLVDVAILIVGKVRVSQDAIATGKTLQMIVRAGDLTSNIALDEASAAGIFVTHCPDKDAQATAELTFGLILALDRRIVENTVALRAGKWTRSEFLDARGLAGRTLGVLGGGETGWQVARRARAFEMNVVAWSPTLTPEEAERREVEFCNWPRELARKSDIVTIHAPPTEEPDRLVDAEFLENMRTGAYLVHVGYSGAIDEIALGDAIERRQLRVALDVFSSEPGIDGGKFRSRLLERPGVIGTQHIGSETEQVRQAISDEVIRIVRTFLVSGEVLHCVNLCERSPATWQLVVRVRDQVGVMAAILEAVRADGINAEEISSRVFRGAKAAWCTIALDERPSTEALECIRELNDVLHLDLRAVV